METKKRVIRQIDVTEQMQRDFAAACKVAGKTQQDVLRELIAGFVQKILRRPVDMKKKTR